MREIIIILIIAIISKLLLLSKLYTFEELVILLFALILSGIIEIQIKLKDR